MFSRKRQPIANFDDRLNAAKYDCILSALKEIVKLEIKSADVGGKETINYAVTCSSIKTRARLALDFVANLEKNGEDE